MKILIVNSYDIIGGAAKAAYRLHKALLKSKIQSTMIVQKKYSNDSTVIQCYDEWNDKSIFYDKMLLLKYPDKTQSLFSASAIPNKNLIDYINKSSADIVHLHWVTNAFLAIEDLVKIQKPIVWSLHDMWAFTGGCHYDGECNRFKNQCGSCPVLNSNDEYDLSHHIFKQKKDIFKKVSSLTFIGLSTWITKCAQSGSLLKKLRVRNIPNTIDTHYYKKLNKIKSREYFHFSQEKKFILFGAMSSDSDSRKGYDLLKAALNAFIKKLSIEEKMNYEFIIFGNNKEIEKINFDININALGHIKNSDELIKLYNAVDIMITPSIQENLSNTIMESLACGTPVTAFDIGGNSDLISHKSNGYLAKPFGINDLANGIDWVLNKSNYEKICINAEESVHHKFSEETVVKQYIKLYKKKLINYHNNNLLIYKANSHIKFITKDIDNWLKNLCNLGLNYVVYGKGTYGELALDYLQENIVAFVDKKSARISKNIVKGGIYSPDNLQNMDYDKIIITVFGREKTIIKYLTKQLNIDKSSIVTLYKV